MATAVYPGSFDVVHRGHLDVIERASRLFEQVIVAVAPNRQKAPLFTTEERVELLRKTCQTFSNVEVDSFSGLLVNYARATGAVAIIRGLRAVSDFEYELQMAQMNRRLAPEINTVFLMTTTENSYLSSSIVREIATLGGDVSGLVPPVVEECLHTKLSQSTAGEE